MEGGGKGKETKATLRQGMERFLQPLKDAARNKVLKLRVVPCGPRSEAFKRFRNSDDAIKVLLVDAEGPVSQSPRLHLQNQDQDKWDLSFAPEETIHLMVRTMETWIVADSAALKGYYGQDFKENKLPRAKDLEGVPKDDIKRSLREATERTKKKSYHKIRHASDLLKLIDVERVKTRCDHCQRLFDDLGQIIDAV